jgi:hypothetical protein
MVLVLRRVPEGRIKKEKTNEHERKAAFYQDKARSHTSAKWSEGKVTERSDVRLCG